MSNAVVTSQPIPSAPENHEPMNGEKELQPSAPLVENVDNVVLTQPAMDSTKFDFVEAEIKDEEEEERRRQRNADFCCYACADSCADDTWCWYIICRTYCQWLGMCCEGFADCMDACGEGCANCLQGCCESDCCTGDSGSADDGCCTSGSADDGCCTGDSGGDDCDCDCSCFN